ncbi:uncharacterized protein LOC124162969 [Ischnura elegans]|uniref:uncharacterized protein LOC124162969 n=1 Tax=Ischnura elegans TaxID=197161 RepID=UPI001ED8972B|nr:uncharacterized protein LOC124162969 [Ischnura elegans]
MAPDVYSAISHIYLLSGRILQRKWKSLRDCFSREVSRLKTTKSGSAAGRKTGYVYFQQLSFLGQIINKKPTCSSMGTHEQVDGAHVQPTEDPSQPTPKTSYVGKRKRAEHTNELEEMVNILKTGLQSRQEREEKLEDDSDRMFLLSLLQPLKEIPKNNRLSIKMELMRVLETARLTQNPTVVPATYQQQTTSGNICPQQPTAGPSGLQQTTSQRFQPLQNQMDQQRSVLSPHSDSDFSNESTYEFTTLY